MEAAVAEEFADGPKRGKGLVGMIQNGIGQLVTRLIILSIPVVGSGMVWLLSYSWNQTAAVLQSKFDQQHQDIVALTDALKSLQGDLRSQGDKLVQAQIDIAKLQAEQAITRDHR
jgi:flagellar motility protein MotE (MotC chaperone)